MKLSTLSRFALGCVLGGALSASALAVNITGAGATFPYPIYAKWAESYKKASGNDLNYQSIGSGGGIKQIKSKTVDFGASDAPLSPEELKTSGLVQFPAIIGGVVPIINLDGIKPGELKLSGPVLADIYLGKISKWNAPEIAALNPGLKLPATDIVVIYRADGSGTTFLFTDYLSKVSPAFKNSVGADKTVKFPTGMGGKGNEGVAANVQRLKGTIGYVEYAYAKKNQIAYAQLQNADGKFVAPDDESFKAAAAGAAWGSISGFGVILTNQPGAASWPITGASFILMQGNAANADKARATLQFFDWSFKNGAQMASALDYVPLPAKVIKLIQDSWKTSLKDPENKPIW